MKFSYQGKNFDIAGVSTEDHIYKKIVETQNFYEINLLTYIRFLKKSSPYENSLAIDVGANIGNHSVFFNSFIAKQLISVEPNPAVLDKLKRNLAQNLKNYSLFECGAGEVETSGKVVLPKDAANNIGMATLELSSEENAISIRPLDSIVEEWQANNEFSGRVTLIKIDVEGMELSVLKGANNTIQKHHPSLFVEAATKEHFEEINQYLTKLDYRALGKWTATPVFHFEYKPSLQFTLLTKIFRFLIKQKRNFN